MSEPQIVVQQCRPWKGDDKMITRIWQGKKEAVESPYYCGQVWDENRQLWGTVTKNFKTEVEAAAAVALSNYSEIKGCER